LVINSIEFDICLPALLDSAIGGELAKLRSPQELVLVGYTLMVVVVILVVDFFGRSQKKEKKIALKRWRNLYPNKKRRKEKKK